MNERDTDRAEEVLRSPHANCPRTSNEPTAPGIRQIGIELRSRSNSTGRLVHANLVQTYRRKPPPLVAGSAEMANVLSNSCPILPVLAAPLGGFEPRRPAIDCFQ
jgi:hypothetical protein